MERLNTSAEPLPFTAVYGYCTACQRYHNLPQRAAITPCLDLMDQLRQAGRIDFNVPEKASHPRLKTDYLWGEARGQMFGVLCCEDATGSVYHLKAFSGQYNGVWEAAGWVPPLFDVGQFDRLVVEGDPPIKALGRRIETAEDDHHGKLLAKQRKHLSRELMHKIHRLYTVHNFKGQTRTLFELFESGIPAGTGDCCAPKLLNYAARRQLKPLAIAEFYWGRTNRSATRQSGVFYPACASKCHPLLGFMLCGADEPF